MNIAILFLLFTASFICVNSLTCLPCGTYDCNNKTEIECPVGIVIDACNCCAVCGKNENELCGGFSYLKGRCGRGLYCYTENGSPATTDGICKKILS
ncbi:single insulin-like growth factor-binding domain protein-2 [Centruroides sculpturatus]|uniref:single insulin-like growth factor-binding domain protein-2 n=1 Tax=Centruroides sculpturatus TaxID=218467 RepID=UPI000C6E5A3C|nr:single insulin-like growth factor-binding domain protein-2 [Centruroides sculpturatus]XP_023234357.1 single insulin-like growth factor-binding domain protein-2 [Centruroides sculpturatus]